MRAPYALAVDGNVRPFQRGTHRTHPAYEACLELRCVEQRKDTSKGVVLGDAIGKRQVLAQPVEPYRAPFDSIGPALCPADDRADRSQQ